MARSSSLMRNIDRHAGVPIVAALGAVRKRRPLPLAPQRIGVLQATALGDAVLSSGVIARLAAHYPKAELTVLHGPTNGGAVRLIDAPFKAEMVNFGRPHIALQTVRAHKFDLTVDLTPWPRLTALCAALSGGVSVGFDSENQHRAAAFDIAVPHSCDVHEIENFAAMADSLTAPAPYKQAIKQTLPPPKQAFDYQRLVLCHPCGGGSQAANRHWPPSHWGTLIQALVREGYQVGVTGAPADAPYADDILKAAGVAPEHAFSLCGAVSFGELAAMLQRVRLIVVIDTGVLHLAVAMNTPIVALHGPSLPTRWGPAPGARAMAVMSPHPEGGYVRFGFETKPAGPDLMPALPPEPVIAAARQMLATHAPALATPALT